MANMEIVFTVSSFITLFSSITCATKPNIVMIVADDLGWDDVSFHGSEEVLTPNIDMLAYTGVALERYYSHCVCTPSRTAVLTGKFAHTLGMHGYPITYGEDLGLPVKEVILPQYLKEFGYVTHLVGKWHLGHSRDEYLPTSRGFDSHFGFRGGTVDYYEYIAEEIWNEQLVFGMDLYKNLTPALDVEGYLTDVFTNKATEIIKSHNQRNPLFLMVSYSAPHGGNDGAILQAPPETVRSMRHIQSIYRRMFAATMKKLDDGVGSIFKALSEEGMLDNTIIVFISDNGGMPIGGIGSSKNYGSNLPLRGSKFTPYEGGIRVTGLLWTPLVNVTNHRWKGYFHAVDWVPTLLKAINAEIPKNIDGLPLWDNIFKDESSTRNELFEIFTYGPQSFGSVVLGDYKLVTGNVSSELTEHLGFDLKGIIGSSPLYNDVVRNSDVYKLLKKHKQYSFINSNEMRNDLFMKVNCSSEDNAGFRSTKNKESQHYLYNIKEDPCELKDLSEVYPEILERLQNRLQLEMLRTVQRRHPAYRDPRASPKLHNYMWSTWANDIIQNQTCIV